MTEKEIKIGLEIHVPLKSMQKLFCECPTNYAEIDEANTLTCPICTAMPGIKPMPINKEALDSVIAIARLLDCKVVTDNIFMKRKHYDYPDLPKGYQITSEPIGIEGRFMDVGIWEVHLEEDPGQYNLQKGTVDYNRSGVPLAEIVSAPDIRTPEQARQFLRELLLVLEYSGRIHEVGGVIRADVNVSIAGGPRTEVKNVNSIRSVVKALEYEIARKTKMLEKGDLGRQETRGFDDEKGITYPLREKETAADYRYIPDPDLPPLRIDPNHVSEIEKTLPEAPREKAERFVSEYEILQKYSDVLVKDWRIADLFEELVKKKRIDAKLASTWICEEVLAQLNYKGLEIYETRYTSDNLGELFELLQNKKITEGTAKKILERIAESGESPKEIVKAEGLEAVSDAGELGKAVAEVVSENPNPVNDYRNGKKEALNFLMGRVMQKMRGRADPKTVRELLEKEI